MLGSLALGISLLVPGEARADILFNTSEGDIFTSKRFYSSQAYAEIKNLAGDNNLVSGGQVRTGINPFGALNESGNISDSPTSLTYRAFAAPYGLGYARNAANFNLNNSSASHGAYNVVASTGNRTQVRFVGYGIGTPNSIDFNFNISGTSSTPYGTAGPRFDFLVRPYDPADGGLVDVFFDPDGLHTFNSGLFTYRYTGSIGQPLDVLFWSAAFVLTGKGDPNSLPFPSAGLSFTSYADYSSTFDLKSIDLFDDNNQLISEWSLVDDDTGQELFNQNGRVNSEAQVPGPLPVVGVAAAFGCSRRLRRRLRTSRSRAALPPKVDI
jgi:hypothetical protein